MPWKECEVVDERMRFVVRLRGGERMVDLCREFGISRKTGYKLVDRCELLGPTALEDQSRCPGRIPHRTLPEIEALLLAVRKAHPTWGPAKLKAYAGNQQPGVKLPAASTIGEILKRNGLIEPRKRRARTPAFSASLTPAVAPNDVWCADFKGQFRLGNGQYCFPLTITDQYSRYLIECHALESTAGGGARAGFEFAFRRFGLPRVIRTDNGTPFASRGLHGLSRLAVWWLRLGIWPERIEPAHPEQNGQHERMHLTLKVETTRPAAANQLQQQERFDAFSVTFNDERPHQALGQKPPATFYAASSRAYPERLDLPEYPLHDEVRKISSCGHMHLWKRDAYVFVSAALAGQRVGLREIDERRWLLSFMNVDLGVVNASTNRLEPIAAAGEEEQTTNEAQTTAA